MVTLYLDYSLSSSYYLKKKKKTQTEIVMKVISSKKAFKDIPKNENFKVVFIL